MSKIQNEFVAGLDRLRGFFLDGSTEGMNSRCEEMDILRVSYMGFSVKEW